MEQVNAHDRAAVITASIAFVLGWGLTIAGFIVPPTGEVSGSVLAVLGEAMIYTASVFGVTLYFKNQMVKFREDTRRYLDRREGESNSPRERYGHIEGPSDSDGVGEEEEN